MIAYNHNIKFIPAFENNKKVESEYKSTMIIRKSTLETLPAKFDYELEYINNQGRDLKLYSEKEFARTQKEQLWAFEVKEVVIFYWSSGTKSLHYIPQEKFTYRLLKYWSLHIVLPMFFTIEETYDFLHAGAVEINEKPILFVAESFGGKSTMTDFFMKQGHKMVSDDKVAVYKQDNEFFSVPSHPHHRPHRAREDLGFFVLNAVKEPKPIHAVYILEKSDSNKKVEIIEIKGVEKFISLRNASQMNLLFLKQKRFEFLIQMVNNVPVYKVMVPWDINKLKEVYKTICKHSKGIE